MIKHLLFVVFLSGFVVAARSQALGGDKRQVLFSWSTGYHYQGFHGTEAVLHLTTYTSQDVNLSEVGIFMGSAFNFDRQFAVFAPDFGVEYIVIPSFKSGCGFSARIHGTVYYRDGIAYLVAAPEVAFNYLTALDIYYAYNYAERPFEGWTPHRIGVRLTLGHPRTVVNIIGINGGI